MNSIFTKKIPGKNKKQKISIKNNNPNLLDSASDGSEDDVIYQMILSLEDIKKSIPKNALSNPDPKLLTTHTEWRWRFLNIGDRKLVEISRKNPNGQRTYIDNTGKWINISLDQEWDKYVVGIKYVYVK